MVSIGLGLTFVPITLIATSRVDYGDAGLASGLLAGDSLDARGHQDQHRPRRASATPSPAEQAGALVDGFHIAFAGAPAFLAAGAILLTLMLKRSDVQPTAVEEPLEAAA